MRRLVVATDTSTTKMMVLASSSRPKVVEVTAAQVPTCRQAANPPETAMASTATSAHCE